jgi:putative oxidoreductase
MRRYVPTVVRVVIGSMMLIVGVLKFIKPDFKVAEDVTLEAFIDSGWLWPLIGAAETVGGLALLVKRFVPIGLAVVAPVVAGIFAFSLKTGGEEAGVGVLLLAGLLYLSWQYREHFRPLWQAGVAP